MVFKKIYNFKFSILWTNVCPQTVLPLRCSVFPSVPYFHDVLHPQRINSFNLNLPSSLSYCKTVVPTFRRNLHPPISTQESSILLRHVITHPLDHTASQYPHSRSHLFDLYFNYPLLPKVSLFQWGRLVDWYAAGPGSPVSTQALYRPLVHRVALVASFHLQWAPMLIECRGTSRSAPHTYSWIVGLIWPEGVDFHVIQQGSFTCRKSATRDKLLYFPSEKIRRLRPGLNPRSWVPEVSMRTTRPPKPLFQWGNLTKDFQAYPVSTACHMSDSMENLDFSTSMRVLLRKYSNWLLVSIIWIKIL
jgi:hypothetical protein